MIAETTKSGVPSWALSAANRLDILMMAVMVQAAEAGGLQLSDPARLSAMQTQLREFEMYEEAYRSALPPLDGRLRSVLRRALAAVTG